MRVVSLTIEVGSPRTCSLNPLQEKGHSSFYVLLFFHALKIKFSMASSQSALLLKKQLAGKYSGTVLLLPARVQLMKEIA